MGDVKHDKQGRFICQLCGKNIARIWTFHRRTESDHYISYRNGEVVFDKLPKDGGIAAYVRDEYLCFRCCFEECGPSQIDIPADLEPGESPEPQEPQERVEYEEGFDPDLAEDDWDDEEAEEDFEDAPPASEDRFDARSDARFKPDSFEDVTELMLVDREEELAERQGKFAVVWGG